MDLAHVGAVTPNLEWYDRTDGGGVTKFSTPVVPVVGTGVQGWRNIYSKGKDSPSGRKILKPTKGDVGLGSSSTGHRDGVVPAEVGKTATPEKSRGGRRTGRPWGRHKTDKTFRTSPTGTRKETGSDPRGRSPRISV